MSAQSVGSAVPSVVDRLSQRSNAALEADAGTHFLRALHTAFPTVAINTDALLQQYGKGTRVRRVFKLRGSDAFRVARDQFGTLTLEEGAKIAAPAPGSLGGARLYFDGTRSDGKPNDYVKRSYEEIEVDCLAKICLPPLFTWQTDAAQSSSFDISFFADNKRDQQVPIAPGASARRPSFASSIASTSSVQSTESAKHYPDGASHYIVGEAYHTMGSNVPFQKLLQLERVLRFLVVKEGRSDVLDCVAGAMFIGSFDHAARVRMTQVLKHYAAALPLLSKLQHNNRFLAINMQQHSTAAVDQFRAERLAMRNMYELESQVSMLAQQVAALQMSAAQSWVPRWMLRLLGL